MLCGEIKQVVHDGIHDSPTPYLHCRSIDIIFLQTDSVKRKTGWSNVVLLNMDGECLKIERSLFL